MILKLFNIKWAGDLTWTDHDCEEPDLPTEAFLPFSDSIQGSGNSQTSRFEFNAKELILKMINDFEESHDWIMDDYEFTLVFESK